MATKLKQAARQALEVLKNQSPDRDMVRAAFALQEALVEQAEQEPVAWILTEADGTMDFDCQPTIKPTQNDYDALREGETFTPLYAAPVRTKDLTDAIDLLSEAVESGISSGWNKRARAVIAADREKNK